MEKIMTNILGKQEEVTLCTWADIKAMEINLRDRSFGTLNDGRGALFFCHIGKNNFPDEWYVTTETIEEIEAQERQEKACTEANDTLLFMTIIFEKLHAINEKGHYTTWFNYSGHIKNFSIKIIEGKWKSNKPGKIVMDGQYGTKGNIITDGFTMQKYTRREFLTCLDTFTKKPSKKSK